MIKYNINFDDVKFNGEPVTGKSSTVVAEMTMITKVQSDIRKSKYSDFIVTSAQTPGSYSPLQQFKNYHGFERTLEFERFLVASPAIGYMERKNRDIKEKSRNRPTLDVSQLESYCIQDSSKSRMALYESIIQVTWENYKPNKNKPTETSESKKRRMALQAEMQKFRDKLQK